MVLLRRCGLSLPVKGHYSCEDGRHFTSCPPRRTGASRLGHGARAGASLSCRSPERSWVQNLNPACRRASVSRSAEPLATCIVRSSTTALLSGVFVSVIGLSLYKCDAFRSIGPHHRARPMWEETPGRPHDLVRRRFGAARAVRGSPASARRSGGGGAGLGGSGGGCRTQARPRPPPPRI
jgi:hypothetical protein